jgi:hypothetical protein
MQTLRLYDPARRGATWTDDLRPGQVVAFAKRIDSGVACTPDGLPFASADSTTCVVFGRIAEAHDWCEASVQRAPLVRFDIFDHEGRARSPLLTIVHPSHWESMDGSPSELRRGRRIAQALIAGGVPLMAFAYWTSRDRDPIFPGFIGLNMVLIALRLFWMNQASREAERVSREHLAEHAVCNESLERVITQPIEHEPPRSASSPSNEEDLP